MTPLSTIREEARKRFPCKKHKSELDGCLRKCKACENRLWVSSLVDVVANEALKISSKELESISKEVTFIKLFREDWLKS